MQQIFCQEDFLIFLFIDKDTKAHSRRVVLVGGLEASSKLANVSWEPPESPYLFLVPIVSGNAVITIAIRWYAG